MGKYFGTDGFRGEAGVNLTADHAYKVGRFLGWYYNALRERSGNNEPARIVIGKDTRRSSYMFEYSLVAGLTASGADAYLLHVTTTPSVAYIARVDDFDCGIMISASHNPFYDNGIKLIDCYGEKMPEETLLLVEDYIDGKLHVFDQDWPELPFAHREHIGCTVDYVAGRNRYMGLPDQPGHLLLQGHQGGSGLRQRCQLEHCQERVRCAGRRHLCHQQPAQRPEHQPERRFHPYRGPCRSLWWKRVWTWALPMTAMQTAASAWTKRAM